MKYKKQFLPLLAVCLLGFSNVQAQTIAWSDSVLTISSSSSSDTIKRDSVVQVYKDSTKRVVIREGIKVIADSAFAGWEGLTSIILPESLDSIENAVFDDCSGLTSIINLRPKPQVSDNPIQIPENAGRKIYVPSNSVANYRRDEEGEQWRFVVNGDTSMIVGLLHNLSVNDSILSFNAPIDGDTTYYDTLNVLGSTDSITIIATAYDTAFHVTPLSGKYPLSIGKNNYTIKVEFNNGGDPFTEYHEVTIKRLSNNNLLESLTASAGTLKPSFNPDTHFYTDTVPWATDSITFTATPKDSLLPAIVGNLGTHPLPAVGDTVFRITVTPEDTTLIGIYTVAVRRRSNDATLKSLTVNGDTISPSDTVPVSGSVDKVTIVAETEHPFATVTGAGNYPLTAFGDTTITITVTAEDPNYSEAYTVVVRRQSNDTTLKTLTVNGDTITLTPGTFVYATSGESADSVTIAATPNDTLSKITGITGEGKYKLPVRITVTAQDGSVGTYTINPGSWSEGIASTVAPTVKVYLDGRNLHIDSPVAEKVSVYSVTGSLLGRLDKQAGSSTGLLTGSTGSPTGRVLIIKGSSGWSKKLVLGV